MWLGKENQYVISSGDRGGMDLSFFGCAQNSTVGAGDEQCASGVTSVGWEGTIVEYLPSGGRGGPEHRALWMGGPGIAPVGWEGIAVVVQGCRACWRWALGGRHWALRPPRNGSVMDGRWALGVTPTGLQ